MIIDLNRSTHVHTHKNRTWNTYTPVAVHPTQCAGQAWQNYPQMEYTHTHTHNFVYAWKISERIIRLSTMAAWRVFVRLNFLWKI